MGRLNEYSLRLREYYQFPKFLLSYKTLSLGAKYLYMLLYNRWRLSAARGWKDSNGDIYFIYTREEMEHALGLTDKPIRRILNELKNTKLLEEVRVGHCKPHRLYLYEPCQCQVHESDMGPTHESDMGPTHESDMGPTHEPDQVSPSNNNYSNNDYSNNNYSNTRTYTIQKDGTYESKSSSKRNDYPEEFEQCWAWYPKRAGANNKIAAYKAWRARVKAGVKAEDLLIATQNYQALMRAQGIINTSYVMHASRLYGPHDEYEYFLNLTSEEIAHATRNNKTRSEQKSDRVEEKLRRIYNEAGKALSSNEKSMGS
jgi:hypothetical protein